MTDSVAGLLTALVPFQCRVCQFYHISTPGFLLRQTFFIANLTFLHQIVQNIFYKTVWKFFVADHIKVANGHGGKSDMLKIEKHDVLYK